MRRRAGRGHAPCHAHPSRMAGETRPQPGRRGRGMDAARWDADPAAPAGRIASKAATDAGVR